MTQEEQLNEWIKGNSIHNDEYDECVPDFSCCETNIQTPQHAKERFVKAYKEKDSETIEKMLTMFLGGLTISTFEILKSMKSDDTIRSRKIH